jgi:hypothetical protein
VEERVSSEDEDFQAMMRNQGVRYWNTENPSLKCHNCHQFGHKAKDCPNETKRLTCILCGKDTHESMDCNEKMCFKCNKRGHQARECKEENVIKCNKCGHVGHLERRCLKEWVEPSVAKMKYLRCMECGQQGHLKCTTEQQSRKIKIDAHVQNQLNEFINNQFREEEQLTVDHPPSDVDAFDYVDVQGKKTKKLTKNQKHKKRQFLMEATNNLMASSDSEDDSDSDEGYDSLDQQGDDLGDSNYYEKKIFGNVYDPEAKLLKIFCAICAGKHSEDKCPNKHYSRSLQLSSIRDRFAQATQFKQVG